MDLCYLGHAGWLAEAAGLRILFDPLLETTHHEGVFEVHPKRTVRAEALRPDVIVVTHRHPDHFDLPSLARLARIDSRRLVLTCDDLVARACVRLGFEVERVDDWQLVPLDGVRLLPTPSLAKAVEWGVLLATDDGVAWNQVDTALGTPQNVRALLARAAEALGLPALARGPDLGLVRWQPLLQVHAVVGRRIGFPLEAYRAELDRIAAVGARAVVPSASGVRHVGAAAWLNRFVYPVPEARFLRDLAARCPASTGLPAVPGAHYRLRRGEIEADLAPDTRLVVREQAVDDRVFAPFAIPELRDPGLDRYTEVVARERVGRWVREELAPAAAAAWPRMKVAGPVKLVLEVVFPASREAWTLVVDRGGAKVQSRLDEDWDVLDAIAGSALLDVLDGRSHWGRALLGGLLRAASRAYSVDAGGLGAANVAQIFLYYALSYDAATERWIDGELSRMGV